MAEPPPPPPPSAQDDVPPDVQEMNVSVTQESSAQIIKCKLTAADKENASAAKKAKIEKTAAPENSEEGWSRISILQILSNAALSPAVDAQSNKQSHRSSTSNHSTTTQKYDSNDEMKPVATPDGKPVFPIRSLTPYQSVFVLPSKYH